jgi:hypothetical protein
MAQWTSNKSIKQIMDFVDIKIKGKKWIEAIFKIKTTNYYSYFSYYSKGFPQSQLLSNFICFDWLETIYLIPNVEHWVLLKVGGQI